TERLRGLLFVHLDDDPPALSDASPALASAVEEAELETRGFHSETTTDIDANWKLVVEQALSDRRPDVVRMVEWPSLILETGGGSAVLHQVIARSFHRTRIHHHHYGAAIAVERSSAQSAGWRVAAVARQAALEAGSTPDLPASPELEAFRAQVRAAHAEGAAL